MKTPHKHAELIKAWADGSEIEMYETLSGKYVPVKSPKWHESNLYRIKKEDKPDSIAHFYAYCSVYGVFCGIAEKNLFEPNLRFVFDGETGKLKEAEVLK
jgi:hypothetical protein